MRIPESQRTAIKTAVTSLVGADSRIWLFGSRVDDSLKGGDIDLLVEVDKVIPNRVQLLCQLEGRLALTLGDRKIDLLIKDARTVDAPVYRTARATGVLL